MVANKDSYLSFKLGNEIFAVSVHKVLEVLEIQNVTKVPNTPEYVRGVINFRGDILPVIETRRKFNMPEIESDKKTVIIVLDLILNEKQVKLGAIADGVRDVLEIKQTDIKMVPHMGSRYNSNFIEGMIKTDAGFLMILDIDKVFSEEEVTLVDETMEEAENLLEEEENNKNNSKE